MDLLTQREAADLLRCSERQISRHRASGKLAFMKLGGNIRFHRRNVEALLSEGTPSPAAQPARSWQATRWTADAKELPAGLLRPTGRAAA
jgi:excisionase family DNA binding protein